MRQNLTISLEEDTCRQLEELAQGLGYSMELAAVYAIRLVSACVREGLIADMPPRAWPELAAPLTGHSGKVLAFDPGALRKEPEKKRHG